MAELLKDIQTYWDMRAGGFSDASMEERKTEPGKHWENIFRNSLEEGCTVLDDGCGAGFFTTLLASMGYQVTAVDYSPKMLEEVRKNLDAENLKADLKQMDVQNLEFPDNSFDAVVSRNVFWNLEHADKAYEEVSRVLKKGGMFAIPDLMSPGRYGDMQTFVQKLRDMGYERVELMDTTAGSFMTPKEAGRLMLRGSTLLVGRK